MKVTFLNENALGHNSYIPPFVGEFKRRPELGIEPVQLDVLPLPERLRWWGDTTIPLLRRWGADLWFARWRFAVSRHSTELLSELRRKQPVDAVVANTQSIALGLEGLARQMPLFVCLDATFSMLSRTRWFAPTALTRMALGASLIPVRRRERTVYRGAAGVFPWSGHLLPSLEEEYGVPRGRIHVMPPSLSPPPRRDLSPQRGRTQILFVGGDFERKGGPLVLECWRRHFADRSDLHVVTKSPVAPEAGLHVHAGIAAGSSEWRCRWQEADVFVFPSTMETFGIVLLEALAFMVPVVSSRAGAARRAVGDYARPAAPEIGRAHV